MRIFTIGHGTRSAEELIACLREAEVETLVDVRRFPASRRNPQFNLGPLADVLEGAAIGYRHAVELGGRRGGEPGEEEFACIRTAAFRAYAAWMRRADWQDALALALGERVPCLMCAETPWTRCHRRLIAELLHARGHEVVHLVRPGESCPHRPVQEAETVKGKLYLCGKLVA